MAILVNKTTIFKCSKSASKVYNSYSNIVVVLLARRYRLAHKLKSDIKFDLRGCHQHVLWVPMDGLWFVFFLHKNPYFLLKIYPTLIQTNKWEYKLTSFNVLREIFS